MERKEERKKMILELMENPLYVPMKEKELAMLLNVSGEDRGALKEVLTSLILDGKITLSKRGKYKKNDVVLITGTFTSHAKGFGFVTPEDGSEDIFIPKDETKSAFYHDLVQVAIKHDSSDGKKREGVIVNILEHGMTEVVGFFQKQKNCGFVEPDNQKIDTDIYVPLERSKGAVTGQKVVVKLTDYGNERKCPEGIVTEILGHANDPGIDILSVVKAYEIPTVYPKEVMEEIESIPTEVMPWEIEGRLDYRNRLTVTIDGEEAKDFDDAISIEKHGDFYELGVHIADVSHYVKEGSPLDKEALLRGTSVYLTDRVIPMLPHRLSNGICSLNEGVDRLTLSCIMEIDESGKIVSHKIAETVIRSDRRMTYTKVAKILNDHDEALCKEYEEFVPMFEMMEELSFKLRARRHERGAIDFDFPECKIILNEKGRPIDIQARERNVATMLIEDFMLAANETVAEDYYWQSVPFLYRSHEKPDPEKIRKLAIFINNYGYTMHVGQEIYAKEIQKLIGKIEGTSEEAFLSRLILRSMKQAKYTTGCDGHFGLSASYYTHFTSPIRRYPDLQIHRIIKENLKQGLSEKRYTHYESILPEVALQTSRLERRAEEAERETDKMKKAEYMQKHLFESFDGVISGITDYGMYVELPNTVEGFIHVSNMSGDYYSYDKEHYEMVGEMTRRRYKMGQKVRIKVIGADKVLRQVEFMLDGEPSERTRKGR